MFKYAHHVHYVVKNRDEMVAYIERTFGMKPDTLSEGDKGVWKEAQYRIGQTLLRIRQPDPKHKDGVFLKEHGPGIHHVAWAVDDVSEVSQRLKASGKPLRDESGFHRSAHGNYTIDIDPEDSLGIIFQLTQDPK